MASEELVNRLRERAKTLWQWAGRAERTTGPSATTEQWRIDGDLHDDAATEIDRLARELEATRAALRIAQTTAANLHDTIRLRDRELEEAREIIRDLVDDEDAGLVWLGRRLVCAYCTADGLYSVAHAADCPIIRARHAIAALRSDAQGDGPVGAVCANCGAPNAAIAGGELDPDEAVCSVECYEQLRELGCPQEHGGDYRPKPARRGEGGVDGG